MKAETGNPHRTSIAVVSRIVDVLQVESGGNAGPDMCTLVSFDNIFGVVMRKLSVANEDAEPTGVKKGSMRA
jgi:hypothetical protein